LPAPLNHWEQEQELQRRKTALNDRFAQELAKQLQLEAKQKDRDRFINPPAADKYKNAFDFTRAAPSNEIQRLHDRYQAGLDKLTPEPVTPGAYGTLSVDGREVPIYLPSTGGRNPYDEQGWREVDKQNASDVRFDWKKFGMGFAIDDEFLERQPIQAGTYGKKKKPVMIADSVSKYKMDLAGLIVGGLGALDEALDNGRLKVITEEKDGKTRMTIAVGSDSEGGLWQRYADGRSRSILDRYDFNEPQYPVYNLGRRLYRRETGEDPATGWIPEGDVRVTIDPKHREDDYSHYLWMDSDGIWMQSPIIYPGDKLEAGVKVNGKWKWVEVTQYSAPTPVSPANQKTLDGWIRKYG